MKINGYEIMEDAYDFTNAMLNSKARKNGKLPASEYCELQSGFMFTSKYEKCYVENLVLGAIFSYHEQLRDILLEKGIDIGEIDL